MEEEKKAMEPEQVSRRSFLSSAGKLAAGATAGAIGLSVAMGKGVEAAETPEYPWKYPGLNPDAVQQAGEELYRKYGCGRGSFEALVASMGEPFTTVPTAMLGFGGAGGAGWGTLCGALNGAACAINLAYPDTKVANKMISQMMGWYTEVHGSGSPLCHASVSAWAAKNGVRTDSQERKDRCAKLTGETARKAAELMNAEMNGSFTATFGPRWNVVECHSCHGKEGMGSVEAGVMQDCAPCHDDPHKA